MTMKQARIFLVLLFVSLACSASSLPIEKVAKFFIAQPASAAGPLSTGGFRYLTVYSMSSSTAGTQSLNENVDASCNFILATVGTLSGSLPTLAISGGGSGTFYPALATPVNGSWPSNQIYYCTNFAGSGTTTFTSSGPGTWALAAYVSSNGVPQFLGGSQTGSSSWTTLQPGAITASGTNFYFASVTHDDGSGGYLDPGWVNILDGGGLAGQDVPLAASYTQTNTTQNPLGTNNAVAPVKGVAAMAMFAVYGSGGGGCTPSYANTGGTGDRRSIITITTSGGLAFGGLTSKLLDGNDGSTADDFFFGGMTLDGSQWMQYDFGSGHSGQITEITKIDDNSFGNGTWEFQYSDDASTWTTLGSSYDYGGASPYVITAPSGNTTFHRYYREHGLSGNTAGIPGYQQIKFKLCYQ